MLAALHKHISMSRSLALGVRSCAREAMIWGSFVYLSCKSRYGTELRMLRGLFACTIFVEAVMLVKGQI